MPYRRMAWIACWLFLTIAAAAQRATAQEPVAKQAASEPTPEQAAKRKERDELSIQAKRLRGIGKLPEAIEVAERVLAIEREIFGEEHGVVASTYGWIGEVQSAAEDFSAAEKSYQAALDLLKRLHGARDWRVTDGRLALEHARLLASLDSTKREALSQAETLEQRVTVLWEGGKSLEAVPLAQEALEIRKHVLGEEHPTYATNLRNLGKLYDSMGDYASAEPLYIQAIGINAKVLGEDHPSFAICLNDLAGFYTLVADYVRAERLHRQALEIQKNAFGEESSEYAVILNDLAELYRSTGEYSRAEPLYRRAIVIFKKELGEEHSLYATSIDNLAMLYSIIGEYARAEPLCCQSLRIRKKVLGEGHPSYAAGLSNLALVYYMMEDFERSESLCRTAIEIQKKVLGEEHQDYATGLNNLARLYDAIGDDAHAESLHRQVLAIRQKILGEAHPHYADSLSDLAKLYMYSKDYAKAIANYQHVLEIQKSVLGEGHPDYAVSLANFAFLRHVTGDYVQAEQLYRQALEIQKKVLGEVHPSYINNLLSLAFLYQMTGDRTSTLAQLRKAASAYEAARLKVAAKGLDRVAFGIDRSPYNLMAAAEAGHGDAISAWTALEADLARGLLDEAASRAGLQLTAAEERERSERTAELEKLQPQILKLVTQIDPSDDAKAELAALLEQRSAAETRLSQLAAALSQRQVADLKVVQAALPADGAFVTWVDFSTKDADVQEHWGCVVRTDRPPVWVRLPGAGANGAWTDEDDGLPRRFREAVAKASSDNIEDLSRQLAMQRIEPLLPHLEGVSRLFVAAVNEMAGVPVEALTDQFTISYTPSGTQLVRLRERERPSGQATLLALGDPVFSQPGDSANDDGNTPAPARLPPGGLLITQVVPDGNAAKARLEAGDVLLAYAGAELETLEQLDELLAAHAGDESVTITVWRESQTQTNERQLGAGKLGVVLSREPAPAAIAHRRESDLLLASVARGKVWDELPGTRIEIAGLAELFDSNHVTLLADSDASEQQLAALRDAGALTQYRYLHLATHGQVNQKSAFESALILAQDHLSTADDVAAGAPFYDGRLTANEILQHWKLNAELVTLSSCESGLGRAGGGEGFLGFAQALLLAGSRSVCLSLWEVDDTATALLMARFYQNLLGRRDGLDSPLPKAKALAEAKGWLRTLTLSQAAGLAANLSHGIARGAGHKTTVVGLNPPSGAESNAHPYDHPYYWAAFVLIGDPE